MVLKLAPEFYFDEAISVRIQKPVLFKNCSDAYKRWFLQTLHRAVTAKNLSILREALAKKLKLKNDANIHDIRAQLDNPDMTMALAQFALLWQLDGEYPRKCLANKKAAKISGRVPIGSSMDGRASTGRIAGREGKE